MKNMKVSFLRRIYLWWKFEGKYIPRNIKYGVKNLITWFPTIWRDRNWDDHFIFELLRVKLENQSKYIGKKNWHTTSKRDAEKMLLVSKLIKLEQEDFYTMEYMDYSKTEYEFIPIEDGKWFEVEDTLISENLDDYFNKYPLQYKKVLSGKINRFKTSVGEKDKKEIAMEIAMENQKRNKELIFKLLNENILKWWN
jgi:hypothetical protein